MAATLGATCYGAVASVPLALDCGVTEADGAGLSVAPFPPVVPPFELGVGVPAGAGLLLGITEADAEGAGEPLWAGLAGADEEGADGLDVGVGVEVDAPGSTT